MGADICRSHGHHRDKADLHPLKTFLPLCCSLSELAPLLESEFELLQKAYSEENYAATKPVLQKIDNILGISEVRYLVHTHVPPKKKVVPIRTLGL